jgi:hypothetical protein
MNNKQKLYLSKAASDPAFQAFGKNYYMPWQDKASFNPAKSFMASAPVDAGKAVGKAALGAGRGLGKSLLGSKGVAKSIGTGGVKGFGPMKGKGVSRGGPAQQEQFWGSKNYYSPGQDNGAKKNIGVKEMMSPFAAPSWGDSALVSGSSGGRLRSFMNSFGKNQGNTAPAPAAVAPAPLGAAGGIAHHKLIRNNNK